MRKIFCFIRYHAKAIAGFATAGATHLAARYAFDLPVGFEAGGVVFLTGLIVYFVPNRRC